MTVRCPAAALALLLVVGGCARGDDPGASPPSAPTGPSAATGPRSVWIAGLRVASDPNELDAETQQVKDVVGPAIAVAPIACFGGAPGGYASSDYVLGVVAQTEPEVEDLVASLGREPLFVARVADLCVH